MNRTFATAAVVAALLGAGIPGLAAAQYVGPSKDTSMTVKQVVDSAKDHQYVTLRGRILSHEGGEHYTFTDGSGQMTVEIDAKLFPANRPIDATMQVEISGRYDKEMVGRNELDVKSLRLLP